MSTPIPAADVLAGFDAGQTHTRCRLARSTGELIGEGEGSGVSHLGSAAGPQRFASALRSSLEAAYENAGLSSSETATSLLAAAVGASGIEAGSPSQRLGLQIARDTLACEHVLVCGDERTALAGAFAPRQAGIVLISGTGSIAIGRDSSGREHRCGGWGWLVDGGGSAMDIGHDGLALSLRMADGRLPETGLKQALWQTLNVEHSHELKALVVDPHFGAAGFARLAPVVSAQAAAGDGPAQQVIAHAGRQLAELVAGVASQLQLTAPPICCSGGAIGHLEPLQVQLKQQLTLLLPQAQLVGARGDACSGALALAQALSS